jgi:hypothetical protein
MKEEYITFQEPKKYQLPISDKPSSFNGLVEVEKYRIIVEKIDEPKEIICERLEKLWITENNFHHYDPLSKKAEELGYQFKGKFGELK